VCEIIAKLIPHVLELLPRCKEYLFFGVDGDVLDLPRTPELEAAGYLGQAISESSETYSLKMYSVWITELISGTRVAVSLQNVCDEIAGFLSLLQQSWVSTNNIVFVFDRLFFCNELVDKIINKKQFFVCRMRRSKSNKELTAFFSNDEVWTNITINGFSIRLVKAFARNSDKVIVLATNLDANVFSNAEVSAIYQRRWGCETANRTTTCSCLLDRFHTDFLNGILQEIFTYVLLSLITGAFVSRSIDERSRFLPTDLGYYKPSLVQIIREIKARGTALFSSANERSIEEIMDVANRSVEYRVHGSRSYNRVVKYGHERRFSSMSMPRLAKEAERKRVRTIIAC